MSADEFHQSCIDAVATAMGAVHPDTPTTDAIESPCTCDENQRKIHETFNTARLELTRNALDAIYKRYKLSAAFLHDYSDIMDEDGKPAQITDYHRVMMRSVQETIRNIQQYGDPNHDPKLMAAAIDLLTDKDIQYLLKMMSSAAIPQEDTSKYINTEGNKMNSNKRFLEIKTADNVRSYAALDEIMRMEIKDTAVHVWFRGIGRSCFRDVSNIEEIVTAVQTSCQFPEREDYIRD